MRSNNLQHTVPVILMKFLLIFLLIEEAYNVNLITRKISHVTLLSYFMYSLAINQAGPVQLQAGRNGGLNKQYHSDRICIEIYYRIV